MCGGMQDPAIEEKEGVKLGRGGRRKPIVKDRAAGRCTQWAGAQVTEAVVAGTIALSPAVLTGRASTLARGGGLAGSTAATEAKGRDAGRAALVAARGGSVGRA
jgi:hypothetical protein